MHGIKLNQVRSRTLSAGSAAALDAAISDFVLDVGVAVPDRRPERVLVSVQYAFDGTTYTALILYAE